MIEKNEFPLLSRRKALGLLASAGVAASLGSVCDTSTGEDPPARTGAVSGEPLATRAIASSGEKIPVIGMGTWQTFDAGESDSERAPLRDILKRFADRGAKLVDSSPMYGRAEQVTGDLAKDLGIQGALFYATKVWTSGRAEGIAAMERSFARFGVARMDLMQVHNLVDVDTHLATLAEWKASGRVRYVGVTHYVESAFPRLEDLIRKKNLDFVQFNYAIHDRGAEARLLPAAADHGVAVIVNQPFGGGELFDRVRGKALPAWAAEIGCATWARFFLKFILGHTAATCVIPATSKRKHLEDNLEAGCGSFPDEATRRRMAEYFGKL